MPQHVTWNEGDRDSYVTQVIPRRPPVACVEGAIKGNRARARHARGSPSVTPVLELLDILGDRCCAVSGSGRNLLLFLLWPGRSCDHPVRRAL